MHHHLVHAEDLLEQRVILHLVGLALAQAVRVDVLPEPREQVRHGGGGAAHDRLQLADAVARLRVELLGRGGRVGARRGRQVAVLQVQLDLGLEAPRRLALDLEPVEPCREARGRPRDDRVIAELRLVQVHARLLEQRRHRRGAVLRRVRARQDVALDPQPEAPGVAGAVLGLDPHAQHARRLDRAALLHPDRRLARLLVDALLRAHHRVQRLLDLRARGVVRRDELGALAVRRAVLAVRQVRGERGRRRRRPPCGLRRRRRRHAERS